MNLKNTPAWAKTLLQPAEKRIGRLPLMISPGKFVQNTFDYKIPVAMAASASHKGVTVLLTNEYNNRYPNNGRKVVDKSGNIVDKIPAEKKQLSIEFPKNKEGQPYPYDCPQQVNNVDTKIRENCGFIVNKRRVTNIVFHMVAAQKFTRGIPRLYFFTVSFPPCVTDDLGYKYFNTWLTRCRKDLKGGISYVWVAERQPDTGTIHFHLAIPHYLNVQVVNRYMKVILTTQVKKGALNWNRTAANKYNGVDIAKHRTTKKIVNFAEGSKQRSLSHYLSKYVTKNNVRFKHLAWNCSNDVSALKASVNFTDSEWLQVDGKWLVDESRVVKIGDEEKGLFALWYPWLKHPPDELINHLAYLNYQILTLLDSPIINLN